VTGGEKENAMTKTSKYGALCALLCLGLVMNGCATLESWDAKKCATVGAVLGGAGGGVGGNVAAIHNDRDDTDDRYGYIAGGAAVGAAAGAALGYLICGGEADKASPTARASATPSEGMVPLTVDFRGVGSDADGRVVGYVWDFGDGDRASGAQVRHTYRSPGTYDARLTVTDDDGLTGSSKARVRVAAPAPELPPPAKVTRRIVLRGVNFDFDSAAIRPDAEVILSSAVEVLKESPEVRVEVAGHTDSTGAEAYNQGLSERRAKAVSDYLTSHGVQASRLRTIGSGEAQPVADNSTIDGRAQNRRVELNVLR
jgi:outer membrane protein OmpA-like peptidoglycan-associated protein